MLIDDYMDEYNKYIKIYGKSTIVLMQVGSFYEIYGKKKIHTEEISGSNIVEISKLFELNIAEKENCVNKIEGYTTVMAGFQKYYREKYFNKFSESGFTVIVISQDFEGPGSTRSVEMICSPGTYFSPDLEKVSNNISCFWLFKTHYDGLDILIVGIASIDIFTSKVACFEYEIEYIDSPTSFDELERFNSIYPANECILITNLTHDKIDHIIQYANIKSNLIHKINIDDDTVLANDAKKCENQIYQKETFERFYNSTKPFTHDLYNYMICSQAFCFLLNFIHSHNPNLIKKIKEPEFENKTNRLILANHSLKQLNMIETGDSNGTYSSVIKMLNQCETLMGKRRFHYNILHPVNNVNYLNQQYDIIEYLLKHSYDEISQSLKQIKDLEKINRKIYLKKATPCAFYNIYNNLKLVLSIKENIDKDATFSKYISHKDIAENCNLVMNVLHSILNLEKCKGIDTMLFEENIFNPGYNTELDTKLNVYNSSLHKMKSIHNYLCNKLKPYEKTTKTTDYVKLHETEKSGFSFVLTKKRSATLQNIFEREKISEIKLEYDNLFGEKEEFIFNIGLLQFTNNSKTNNNVVSPQINEIFGNIQNNKNELKDTIMFLYGNFSNDFQKHINLIDNIIHYIIDIDLILCKRNVSKQYNYCKPTIVEKENGYLNVCDLRHCLIEHIQKNELYVPNDILFDNSLNGILLFGTNAVGKTSLIKSIGIAIILAQSGMFVPATSFEYQPYEYIFTRILGNDNIFKCLSTFEVEMTELRTILKLCNNKSLILGDELCSGTESDSALGIFTAGIQEFHKKNTNFIFATHFHEIVNYDELKELDNLKMKHMEVKYDDKTGKLIYDRKLKDGPGDSMYGLEVCKSLNLPLEFLNRAHEIRNKYNKNDMNILTLKKSRYNSEKLKGMCEICKKQPGEEIHHLQFQKNANDNGFINTFHKNHKANLISICELCHDKIHRENMELKKVKTSEGYELVVTNEN